MSANTPLALEIREYVKAIVGGATTATGVLVTALPDGITQAEGVGVLAAFLAGFAAVFYAKNDTL